MVRLAFSLALSSLVPGCAGGPPISEDIREQCMEQRANLDAFCSTACRMATAGTTGCAADLPDDLYACVSARGAVMPCTSGVPFADCDAVADCAALQPIDVQQRLFDSEQCVRMATVSVCE